MQEDASLPLPLTPEEQSLNYTTFRHACETAWSSSNSIQIANYFSLPDEIFDDIPFNDMAGDTVTEVPPSITYQGCWYDSWEGPRASRGNTPSPFRALFVSVTVVLFLLATLSVGCVRERGDEPFRTFVKPPWFVIKLFYFGIHMVLMMGVFLLQRRRRSGIVQLRVYPVTLCVFLQKGGLSYFRPRSR